MTRRIHPSVRSLLGSDVVAKLEALTEVDSSLGIRDLILDVIAIVAAIVLASMWSNIAVLIVAVFYIGVRQRHLSNLGHELVHSKLVKGQRRTLWIGTALMFALGEPFVSYRQSHWRHHARLGRRGDPMLESYLAGHALEPRSGRLHFLLSVYLRSVVWRLPIETLARWGSRGELESEAARMMRIAGWALAVLGALALGVGWQLAAFWIVPLVVIRPAATWLTDLGNHAGVAEEENPLFQSRGWTSGWLTRHLLGGHLDDMYHPVHHLSPDIPWRRLPEADELLRTHVPEWSSVPWCSGFFFRRSKTPRIPCVLEDIVVRVRNNAKAQIAK